ncbi:MAG: hypothetical protein H6748_03045 [Spirochaetaceae bacterium]|nr:hypothetical protein [Myxococcales bacterium]MCB9723004.1 hypothetical protein [Spirochaetaceae bacterium]
MASGGRRGLPDNLDPLVDTLSNVVGILVIVIATMQIQLGDALERVLDLAIQRAAEAGDGASGPSARALALDRRRDEIFRRADAEADEATRRADALRAALERAPSDVTADGEDLESRLADAERELARAREALQRRREHVAVLERAPREKVARLPDPAVVQGRESWVLVRYGRIYLVDREALYEAGSEALDQMLVGVETEAQTRAALEEVDFYLRKKAVGFGRFRWRLDRERALAMRLVWEDLDDGLEATRLDEDPAFAAWLSIRDPARDVIAFQVWADSFEAYLAARERVERAGFRASWTGYETDEEVRVPIRFGARRPAPIGPIEID